MNIFLPKMELNRFIFAAPAPSYTIDDMPSLILIPRVHPPPPEATPKIPQNELSHRRIRSHEIRLDSLSNSQSTASISYSSQLKSKKKTPTYNDKGVLPALYLRYSMGSNKILLFFHANAEDLGMISTALSQLSQYLKINVLAAEYPGYGVYKGSPTSAILYEDASIIYEYTTNILGFKGKDILVAGRSIGSGPACFLASDKEVSSLILISPFKSLKAVVKSSFGRIAAFFVAERFKNIELLSKMKCPILFIHGRKDKMVPIEHSFEMAHVCKETGKKHEVAINEEMGHNDISTLQDLCLPIIKFLKKMEIEIKNDVKYIKNMPEETAWKLKSGNLGANKRKNSLMKVLMEKSLKEV